MARDGIETWTDEDDGTTYVSCSELEQGDYCGASWCEANVRALEGLEGAWVRHGAHHNRQLWLPDTEGNRETCRYLSEDYPIWDEEMDSRVRDEWEREAWDDYGLADL